MSESLLSICHSMSSLCHQECRWSSATLRNRFSTIVFFSQQLSILLVFFLNLPENVRERYSDSVLTSYFFFKGHLSGLLTEYLETAGALSCHQGYQPRPRADNSVTLATLFTAIMKHIPISEMLKCKSVCIRTGDIG